MSLLTLLPRSVSLAGPRFHEIPEEYEDLYALRRPNTPLPGGVGGGGGDGGDDPPDPANNNNNSSLISTPDTQELFRDDNRDDLNQVPLAFEPFTQLADVIHLMTCEVLHKWSSDGGKTKVWEPDPFNGNDPKKFRAFIVQCEINFQANLKSF